MTTTADLPEAVTSAPGSAAATMAWRHRGQSYLTVIAKATFAFATDAPMPRTEPQEIFRAEVHHGRNPARSVRFSSDLVPALARADVLFTGHACPPRADAVRAWPVRLAVFADLRPLVDKRLLVQTPGGADRVPLTYELSLRGADDRENPFGIATTEGQSSIVDPAHPERPAGFGPIGRAVPARRRLRGSLPASAFDGPLAEIPESFDWSYFQAAPPDQQTEFLRGDEWILLGGLHPDLPLFRTRLPGARGMARLHGLSAFGVEEGRVFELRADTLRIDGAEQRVTVVWRGSFPVAEAALGAVKVVAGVELAGEAIVWPEPAVGRPKVAVPRPAGSAPVEGTSALSTAWAEGPPSGGALPFEAGSGESFHGGDARGPAPQPPVDTGTLALSGEDDVAALLKPLVPFRGGAAHSPVPQAEPFPATTGSLSAPIGDPIARTPWAASSQVAEAHPSPWASSSPVGGAPLAAPLPPPIPPAAGPFAGGVLEVSNAAIGAAAPGPEGIAAHPEVAAAESAVKPARLMDLVWFDRKSLPRIRRHPAWRELIEDLNDQPPDPDIDDPELDLEPAAAEERREIFEVLAKGKAAGDEGLRGALAAAVRKDGRFVAPLVLVEGEMLFPFDEIETLRALVAVVGPLGGDERVKTAVAAGRDFLSAVGPLSSRRTAERLGLAIREVYSAGKRDVPAHEVEEQVEHGLLDQRCYQRRAVLGGQGLRCLLRAVGSEPSAAVPAYLPETLARTLPMFQRFGVRVVAEVHPAADQREVQRVALRVVALARLAAGGG